MPSERKIAANRGNARKSTGPRSARGKAHTAQNALRHGLASTAFLERSAPDGCTRAEMSRRGFGPAVLNDLLLKRLAIAHMATEVRGGIAIQTRLTITPAGLREIVGGEGDE